MTFKFTFPFYIQNNHLVVLSYKTGAWQPPKLPRGRTATAFIDIVPIQPATPYKSTKV